MKFIPKYGLQYLGNIQLMEEQWLKHSKLLSSSLTTFWPIYALEMSDPDQD
jgi:hypothetical protein